VVGVLVAGVVVAGVLVTGVVVVALLEVAADVPATPVTLPAEDESFAEDWPALSSELLVVTGTSGGGLDGTLSATVEPPQAPSATALAAAPSSASDREARVTRSRPERAHATAAGRAVVEVALRELVTPRTDAQVLDGPGEIRLRRREWKQLADHLERLAGVAVGVDPVRFCLDDHLAAARRRAQAIAVAVAHLELILPTGAG
jgi:hypothetical protein